jgi:hypothetical protein
MSPGKHSAMKYLPLFLITMLLHGAVSAEMRYWRQADGSVFEGEYLRQNLGNAYFKGPDRKTHSVAVTNLVVSDMKYLEAMVPPKVDIRVKIKEVPEEGEYRDPNRSDLNAQITLKKISKKPFSGTLNGELYLVRREIADAYPDTYRILTKRKVQVRFPDTKNASVQFDLSEVVRWWSLKSEDRGWAYEGYLVVLLSPDGAVLQTKSDLRWLDDEKLETFRQLETYRFFDKDCRKKSTPRPRYFSNRTM